MKPQPREVVVRVTAGLMSVFIAAFTVPVDGEPELLLFMVSAVIASLGAFDAALDRRNQAFGPWLMASAAIVVATVPTVLGRLFDATGPRAENWDHVASVLPLILLIAALLILARPAREDGGGLEDRVLIILGAVAIGLAGLTAAHAGAQGFATRRTALVYDFFAWAGIGGVLIGAVVVAAVIRRPSRALVTLLLAMLGAAWLGSVTAAGQTYDIGYRALGSSAIGLGALLWGHASLSHRMRRRRTTWIPAIVAVLAAIFALRAAIIGGGDAGGFRLATIPLVLSAAALLGLGLHLQRALSGLLTAAPDERSDVFDTISDSTLGEDELAAVMEPDDDAIDIDRLPDYEEAVAAAARGAFSQHSGADLAPLPVGVPVDTTEPAWFQDSPVSGGPPISAVHTTPADVPTPATPEAPAAAATQPMPAQPMPAQPMPAQPMPAQPMPEPAAPAVTEESAPAPLPVSVASAQGAAAPLPLPADVTVDPPTGLLAPATLQQVLLASFAEPVLAGRVNILMVAIRNLDELEETQGRVAAAQLAAELATRFRAQFGEAHCARFAPTAFAAVIPGPPTSPQALIDRCADALVGLLAPVDIGGTAVSPDVAAGMSQCRAAESANSFVARANQGLEQAVANPEPSLVAMP